MTTELKKRGRGRPRKSEVAAVKPGTKGQEGRPTGAAAIINEYQAGRLAAPAHSKRRDTSLATA